MFVSVQQLSNLEMISTTVVVSFVVSCDNIKSAQLHSCPSTHPLQPTLFGVNCVSAALIQGDMFISPFATGCPVLNFFHIWTHWHAVSSTIHMFTQMGFFCLLSIPRERINTSLTLPRFHCSRRGFLPNAPICQPNELPSFTALPTSAARQRCETKSIRRNSQFHLHDSPHPPN